jgi:predicted kinase
MNLLKPKLIIIDGPMGAGKTTAANLLHLKLPNTVVNGICRIKHCISGFLGNKKEYKIATEVILGMCQCYLKHGKSVIIEQSFREKKIMKPYLDFAQKNNLPLFVYELFAPKKVLLHRIRLRPKAAIKHNVVSYKTILKNIDSYPHRPYGPVRLSFDSSKISAQKIVNQIIKDIKIG